MHLSTCTVSLFQKLSGFSQAFRDEPPAIQAVQKCCRRKLQGLLQGYGSFLCFPKQKSLTLKFVLSSHCITAGNSTHCSLCSAAH